MSINFNDVATNTGEFKSLPEGWYGLRAEEAKLQSTKNGPDTMIKVKFAVVTPAKYSKRKVWNNFNLTAKSLWALKVYLEKAGLNPETLGDLTEQQLANKIPGTVVEGFLEPSTTPEGKQSNDVQNFRELSSAPSEPSTAASDTRDTTPMFK